MNRENTYTVELTLDELNLLRETLLDGMDTRRKIINKLEQTNKASLFNLARIERDKFTRLETLYRELTRIRRGF